MGLNQRPPACEADALPLSYAPTSLAFGEPAYSTGKGQRLSKPDAAGGGRLGSDVGAGRVEGPLMLPTEGPEAAKAAGLRYTTDAIPGIRRVKRGKS